MKDLLKKYAPAAIMFALFETLAFALWLTLDNIFYLFNFTYIGGFLALGLILYIHKWGHARLAVQVGVGLYMLVYLGLIRRENMQIEGFWYYLFSGAFEAATIHYAVAKLFGPLFFGRGWCGYACWTAMVLDLLPYKQPEGPRKKGLGWLRYFTFGASLLFVALLFGAQAPEMDEIMFQAFILGNAAYYAVGIALAVTLKDNRAFCKYICPVTVFLKPMSYFACLRVKVDEDKCVKCGMCRRSCPMNVDVTTNSRGRENATECILCGKCVGVCPRGALKL